MKHTIRALALTLALTPGLASAQQFPNISAQSVIGRLGIPGQPGPAQSIPFNLLAAQLALAGNLPISPVNPTPGNAVLWGSTSNVLLDAGFAPQPVDADLTCLAALTGTGILRRTGSGTCSNGTTTTIAEGGTGQITQQAALNALAPTPTRAGDLMYWNGTNWVAFAGNNSGTQFLQESSSGVPSWAAPTGTGTVTTAGPGLVISGGGSTLGRALNEATTFAAPAAANMANSTTQLMFGFGSVCKITPVYSSRVRVTISGSFISGGISSSNIRFGLVSGGVPTSGATASSSGTALFATSIALGTITNATQMSFDAVATGLTAGQQYWFDLAGAGLSAGNIFITQPYCILTEY